MTFTRESDFEDALVEMLGRKGWEAETLDCPKKKTLLANWASILFDNNVA
jgi:type I restriction enzyme R subunit